MTSADGPTIPITVIASIPWETLTTDQKRSVWARLRSGDYDTAYLQGDYDMIGSNRRYELGE